MNSAKYVIDKEIDKLDKKGFLGAIEVLLVSPSLFSQLKQELNLKLQKCHINKANCITYRQFIIMELKLIPGYQILPYFNRKKLS